MSAISDLNILLKSMQPVLNAGVYYFATLPEQTDLPAQDIIACIREQEGLSVVISEEVAQRHHLVNDFRSAWITLNVHSDLSAVGLTAVFATALGEQQISCNVVAGHYHDHIFVPYEQAQTALNTLLALQQKHATLVQPA